MENLTLIKSPQNFCIGTNFTFSPLPTVTIDTELDQLKKENQQLKTELAVEKRKVEFLLQKVEELEEHAIIKPRGVEETLNWLASRPGGRENLKQAHDTYVEGLAKQVESEAMSKIKFYRLRDEMDQKTLARLLKTKQSNISRMEKVAYHPRHKTLEKLSKIFKVEVKDLL